MIYERQQQVTRECVVSEDTDYWLVGSEGTTMRPSNWAERIASTFMSIGEFRDRHKIVMECVAPAHVNDRLCLKVRKAFQAGCREGWRYIEQFACSNRLSIVDNHGLRYTPTAQPGVDCSCFARALKSS